MIIGRMTERIVLMPPVSEPDGMGGRKTAYPESAQIPVWAEFKRPRHETVEHAGGIASELFRDIGIRYRSDVRKGWRVGWNNKILTVEHAYDYGRADTILVCKEIFK